MPEHVRLTGDNHPRPDDAPSHTRHRSSLSLPQRACVALFCVGNRTPDTSALQHHHQSAALSPSSYQQRACVEPASSNRDSRSPRPQVNRREVRPHLCAPAQASVTALPHPTVPQLQTNQASQVQVHRAQGLPLMLMPRFDVSPYPSCP